MIDRLSDLLLSFLIITKIKKMDFYIETVPSEEVVGNVAFECCAPNALRIVADYKWFWQKLSSTNINEL